MLLAKFQSSPLPKFAPIVVLTTESQEDRKRQAKAAGATGWIVKPFVPAQLLAVVNKVMR